MHTYYKKLIFFCLTFRTYQRKNFFFLLGSIYATPFTQSRVASPPCSIDTEQHICKLCTVEGIHSYPLGHFKDPGGHTNGLRAYKNGDFPNGQCAWEAWVRSRSPCLAVPHSYTPRGSYSPPDCTPGVSGYLPCKMRWHPPDTVPTRGSNNTYHLK